MDAEMQMERAAILRRHQQAWNGVHELLAMALEQLDASKLKALKMAIRCMRDAQEAERRAWGIENARDLMEALDVCTPSRAVAMPDFSSWSREALRDLVRSLTDAPEGGDADNHQAWLEDAPEGGDDARACA